MPGQLVTLPLRSERLVFSRRAWISQHWPDGIVLESCVHALSSNRYLPEGTRYADSKYADWTRIVSLLDEVTLCRSAKTSRSGSEHSLGTTVFGASSLWVESSPLNQSAACNNGASTLTPRLSFKCNAACSLPKWETARAWCLHELRPRLNN
jgi:hypothetical protein